MIRRCLFALGVLLFLFAPSVQAQTATYDTSAAANCDNDALGGLTDCATSFTVLAVNITIGNNTNRALAVAVLIGCNGGETPPTISSVSDGTNSLTQQQMSVTGGHRQALYAYTAGTQPAVGAITITTTLSSGLNSACSGSGNQQDVMSVIVISAYNVDQTTTFTTTNIGTGSSATASLTLSSSGANDLGFHMACAGSNISSTTETSRQNLSGLESNSCGDAAGATAAGGDTSFSWTISASDSWGIVGGAFKAASGGGATPCRLLLILGAGCDLAPVEPVEDPRDVW